MKLGFDYGTSFSLPAVCYLDQKHLLLPGGKYGIPSVFFYSDWDGILIGEEAEDAGQGEDAKNLKREIKLELGSSFTADGRSFTAKQIVASILNGVKQTALSAAKSKLIDEELEGVVISVPAAFGQNEKQLIREAAELPASEGGPELRVLGLIKEPVAAALAYFSTSLADKTRILVYDLGGGTCDVAIVEADSAAREKYTVIDSDMLRIGGRDWDAALETYFTNELEKQSGLSVSGDPAYREKIRRAAVSAKHAFSEKLGSGTRDRVRARIELNGRTYQIPLTAAVFDELTRELMNKTVGLVKKLLDRNDGGSISRIICVGGGSNMPQVQGGLKRAFPSRNILVFEPEKAIAFGAAIYAQLCDGKEAVLSDIASFSYGTDCFRHFDEDPDEMIVVNLIRRGDRLPVSHEHSFVTVKEGRTGVSFNILENPNAVDSYEYNSETGSVIMTVFLDFRRPMPKGTPVSLRMTLTPDGILEVAADDKNGHAISVKKQLYF